MRNRIIFDQILMNPKNERGGRNGRGYADPKSVDILTKKAAPKRLCLIRSWCGSTRVPYQ